MKYLLLIIILLLLISCKAGNKETIKTATSGWPGKWYYSIVDPYMFPAEPRIARMMNTKGDVYESGMILKGVGGLNPASQGKWGDNAFAMISTNDAVPGVPWIFSICWFSVVEQKTYESTITIPKEGSDLMQEEAFYRLDSGRMRGAYRRVVYFGLAPGGAIKAWLRNPGPDGKRVVIAKGSSVSEKEMKWCPEIVGYQVPQDTKDFIKDKQFPYGEW
jgi:hypothetical protein